jgi:hypothetical protein
MREIFFVRANNAQIFIAGAMDGGHAQITFGAL